MQLIGLAIRARRTIEIAPDGGLSESKGIFGVVLARPRDSGDMGDCWPVDCNPGTVNSKRSELAGYTASKPRTPLHDCSLFWELDTRRMLIKTLIDSSSVGQHVSNMLQTRYAYFWEIPPWPRPAPSAYQVAAGWNPHSWPLYWLGKEPSR